MIEAKSCASMIISAVRSLIGRVESGCNMYKYNRCACLTRLKEKIVNDFVERCVSAPKYIEGGYFESFAK